MDSCRRSRLPHYDLVRVPGRGHSGCPNEIGAQRNRRASRDFRPVLLGVIRASQEARAWTGQLRPVTSLIRRLAFGQGFNRRNRECALVAGTVTVFSSAIVGNGARTTSGCSLRLQGRTP